MPRPKALGETVAVTVRLPVDVHAEWARRAAKNERRIGEHIRVKLTEAVRGPSK